MNIFQTIKGEVTARQAADFYGMDVNRSGMTKCIFHEDHEPSMKVDKRFFCFGCHATGDVIDLVGKMFGLSPYEAAKKLAKDFCISLSAEEKESEMSRDTADQTPADQDSAGETTKMTVRRKKKSKKVEETEEQKKEKRIRRLEERINAWLTRAEEVLIRYFRLLNDWEKSYRPGVPGSDPDPRFVEAMQNKSAVEYQLNILQFGSERDRLDFSRRRERK